MNNETMSKRLRDYALELEKEGGSLFRARAFRTAAGQLLMMSRSIGEVFEEEGRAGLERVPGIGKSLAYTVEGLLRTGELQTLHPLAGQHEPDRQLTSLPGVGMRTAELLRDRLGITTLERLREAASEGRLAEIGMNPRRQAELLEEVEHRLGLQRRPKAPGNEPGVADLLEVDEEYRRRAEQDELPKVAPRWFNPEGDCWLGVLRSEKQGWKVRALYSNTAVAHRLGQTRDWVVVYFDQKGTSGQRTVVTETRGDLAGKRVVRGRENECRAYYQNALQAVGPAA